jgi:acetyl esterase/lipase
MKNRLPSIAAASLLALAGVLRTSEAQLTPPVIALWPAGAPGFESRRNEPELARDWWVKNIHNPSLTAFLPPKGKATGTAVIVAPGGGFRELVFNAEGKQAAEYLSSLGVAAFALKYRLPGEPNSPYTREDVRADAYRAMRLVRSRAKEFGIDPTRVGMLGFSAGGDLVGMVAYAPGKGDPNARDPIDRLDGKPSFQMLVYPGGKVPDMIPKDAPPAFLLVASDDEYGCDETTLELYTKLHAAGVPVEAHFLTRGKHGFNMGDRSSLVSVKTWPERMADWLRDSGYLTPTTAAK